VRHGRLVNDWSAKATCMRHLRNSHLEASWTTNRCDSRRLGDSFMWNLGMRTTCMFLFSRTCTAIFSAKEQIHIPDVDL
jgi:hypothetical protein